MKKLKAYISGVAGALTLTAAHQILKSFVKEAPRIDLMGTNAVNKIFRSLNLRIPEMGTSYKLSLAGDLLFNSLYYSLTALGKRPLINGSLLGISAGTGVISLPGLLNLGKNFSARTNMQKLLSFGLYLSGGLTSAAVFKLLKKV